MRALLCLITLSIFDHSLIQLFIDHLPGFKFPVGFMHSTETRGVLTLLEMIADTLASEMGILGSEPSIAAFCLIIHPGSLSHNDHGELSETLPGPPKGTLVPGAQRTEPRLWGK